MSNYLESLEKLKQTMQQFSGNKPDERYLKPINESTGYDDATLKLKRTLEQVLPQESVEPNSAFVPDVIPLTHEFKNEEEFIEHMSYVKLLDKLSNEREQAAMKGDEVQVAVIDAQIRTANKDYVRKHNV